MDRRAILAWIIVKSVSDKVNIAPPLSLNATIIRGFPEMSFAEGLRL